MILWITGASSGIGRETAKAFLQRGDTVYATARNTDSLNALASEVQGLPGKLYSVSCDMRDKGAVAAFVQEHFSEQKPDGFINAAGITSFTFIADDTLDVIENIIQTNLLGAIYGIKSVLPLMKEKGGGVIVNILSVVTEKVLTKSGAYSASKAGLLAFLDVLREESRKSNIRVVSVTPGATNTPIWNEKVREKYGAVMMDPVDIAKIIVYAVKDAGSAVPEDIVLRPIGGDL